MQRSADLPQHQSFSHSLHTSAPPLLVSHCWYHARPSLRRTGQSQDTGTRDVTAALKGTAEPGWDAAHTQARTQAQRSQWQQSAGIPSQHAAAVLSSTRTASGAPRLAAFLCTQPAGERASTGALLLSDLPLPSLFRDHRLSSAPHMQCLVFFLGRPGLV